MGITNMLAAIPGFIGPIFVGWITNDNVKIYLNCKFTIAFTLFL